jgi:hypothetical protein
MIEFVRRNWTVVLIVLLLLGMFLLAPDDNPRFIYTEF